MKKASALVLVALIPLLGLVFVQASLTQRQSLYKETRHELQTALAATKARQNKIAQELRSDPSLHQNLSMQLYSAVGRTLGGYVQSGKIDHLVLVDANCKLLAQSEQGTPLHSECPIDSIQAIKSPIEMWQSTPQGTLLSVVTPISLPSGEGYVLKVSTLLTSSWLKTFPELNQHSRDLGLTLEASASPMHRVLWQAAPASQGKPSAFAVYANDPRLLLVPSLLDEKPLDFSLTLGLALAGLLTSIGWLLKKQRQHQQTLHKAMQDIHQWIFELEGKNEDAPSHPELDLETIKATMGRLMKKQLDVQTRLEHQQRLLQQQIVKLEGQLVEKQAEHMWFHQAQSLQQQMQSCAQSYLEKLQESLSLSEDLSYVASREIFKPAQRLFELSTRWDLELSKQASKKFIRTLTERIQEDGRSELDISLDTLIQDSHNVGNCAINLSMLSQKLIAELKATASLAEHWYSMLQGTASSQGTLLAYLQESQALIKHHSEGISLSYDNLVETSARLQGLDIVGSTLTSALYHAQLALIEMARDQGVTAMQVSTQLKKRADRNALVISLQGETQDQLLPSSEPSPKAAQHLTLAIQLLQGQAIKITQLPPLPGIYALAFMWNPQAETSLSDLNLRAF